MSENLGTGVSFVVDPENYNYDTVVFQKGKPLLDTEQNLVQQLRNHIDKRQLATLPSGWLSFRPNFTSKLLQSSFYTQDPSTAVPEYALVDGMVIKVTNTATSIPNANLINLPAAPVSANQLNGVYLEVWRALLSPTSNANKPDPITKISSLLSVSVFDDNHAWASGEFGLILATTNAGETWNVQAVDTKYNLNGINFFNGSIGWAVGDNGTIAKTSSAGTAWTVLTTNFTENLNDVFTLTQLVAWAVGNSGTILKTSNGVTWLPLTSGVIENLNDVHFLDAFVGWAAGDNGTILKTVDGGAHWIKAIISPSVWPNGSPENLNGIYFYDNKFGFAVGNNGVILGSSDGGASWVSQVSNVVNGTGKTGLSVNYTDVTMAPNLDIYADGEEVSGQFNGTNNTFTVMNAPITVGNGKGTVTNNPADIMVKVNGQTVLVDSVVGATGQVVLHVIPAVCDTVKIYYWYKADATLFRGKAWITGQVGSLVPTLNKDSGIVLESVDLGENWIIQDPLSGYDINAVSFSNQYKGWVVGGSSVLRHTVDSGSTWVVQSPNLVTRQQQRVFNEGNTATVIFLNDDSIHPDANIETTKRVQVQYRIRVAKETDPVNFPEAGLGNQSILGLGPNATGTFAFENQGPSTGDYGLWRAKCLNTVDGYCYAIPMFFVNRRNSTAYDPSINSNGTTVNTSSTSIRPDLLTYNNVVDSDILDVRRKILYTSAEDLLVEGMEILLNGTMETRIVRDSNGGADKYGTQLLQVDRIGGAPADGGQLLATTHISDAVLGLMSSDVQISTFPADPRVGALASTVPTPVSLNAFSDLGNGYFHPNTAKSAAVYVSTTDLYNRKPIPGDFTGFGTSALTFTFKNYANTLAQDIGMQIPPNGYSISSTFIGTDATSSLTNIPSNPQLVKNYDNSLQKAVYYNGVFESETSGKIIEEWSSGISGYTNYVLAYPGADSSTSTTLTMASTVELHYFIRGTSTNIVSSNVMSIGASALGIDSTNTYSVLTISKVKNVTASGFAHKIANVSIGDPILITSVTGYEFPLGSVYEVVAQVLASNINTNVRSGATANFKDAEKTVKTFCLSDRLTVVIPGGVITDVTMTSSSGSLSSDGDIIGISSAERLPVTIQDLGLILPVCWADDGSGLKMLPINIRQYGSTLIFTVYNPDGTVYNTSGKSTTVIVQALIKQNSFIYSSGGLLIGYFYRPYQSTSDLPTTLTVKMLTRPTDIAISDLGTGGSLFNKSPYGQPLSNIPVNDPVFTSDNQFFNIEPMRFISFSVDGGFVKMPAYTAGNFDGEFTFSTADADKLSRAFYSESSKEISVSTEGLRIGSPRKIFVGAVAQVIDSSDSKFPKGEYVLVIFSRNAFTDTNNYTGYISGDKSAIAIYRLPNRPLIRG